MKTRTIEGSEEMLMQYETQVKRFLTAFRNLEKDVIKKIPEIEIVASIPFHIFGEQTDLKAVTKNGERIYIGMASVSLALYWSFFTVGTERRAGKSFHIAFDLSNGIKYYGDPQTVEEACDFIRSEIQNLGSVFPSHETQAKTLFSYFNEEIPATEFTKAEMMEKNREEKTLSILAYYKNLWTNAGGSESKDKERLNDIVEDCIMSVNFLPHPDMWDIKPIYRIGWPPFWNEAPFA